MIDAIGAMSAAGAPEGAPREPLLDIEDIQGNTIPGFMKPRQGVMALRFGDVRQVRSWLASLASQLTTISGVMPSRVRVRRERLARRVTAGGTQAVLELDDLWMNLGVTHGGIAKLFAGNRDRLDELAEFTDDGFTLGLARRSGLLGDPIDLAAEGNPVNWVVGAPGREPDAILIFGADQESTIAAGMANQAKAAQQSALTVLYMETGSKLTPAGQEHFGFRDGVSQPGPRGLISTDPDTFLTPRTIDASAVPEASLFGLPGQYLVWPGEFVFGYPSAGADPMLPGPEAMPGPAWSRNGAFLVFRRLRQDVAAFRQFVAEQAKLASERPGFEEMTPELLASMVVGRWPSGAPLARSPAGDDAGLGGDPLANNHFGFAAPTGPLPLVDGGTTNTYPQAPADPLGITCPLPAHIRKVNARDAGSDQGGKRASFNRRILRTGLPFGPPLPDEGPDPVAGNRGLLFLSTQTSITDQFEFLNSTWMGDPSNPRSPSGHDMLVGQNGQPGQNRVRSCVFLSSEGTTATVTTESEFVIPTGGGYFFVPAISTLRSVLAATT